MRTSVLVAALSALSYVAAAPCDPTQEETPEVSEVPEVPEEAPVEETPVEEEEEVPEAPPVVPAIESGPNPFDGKKLFANPAWAEKLEMTYDAFVERDDEANAAKVRIIQNTGTFVWVSDIASLTNIDDAIEQARAIQEETGEEQVVGLVLYNLPDRDCSAGESAGELVSLEDGMERYKTEFIDVYAEKVSAADDLTFAIVLEPDSLGNAITNTGIEFCATAIPVYEEGLAYAIANLQFENVHLYVDAAHGGWLGWTPNLAPTAAEFAKVVNMAREVSGSNSTKIRGFSTNVSNYNPFNATVRENYTEHSTSWDESNYVTSLSEHLLEQGLPSKFIVDQGRVHLPGGREEWGEWCNVAPAGFGMLPGTPTTNENVDSIVWIKPGGESDGECGMEGATRAGQWFEEYVEMLVENFGFQDEVVEEDEEVVEEPVEEEEPVVEEPVEDEEMGGM